MGKKNTKYLKWGKYGESGEGKLIIDFHYQNGYTQLCGIETIIFHDKINGYSGFSIDGKTIPYKIGVQLSKHLKFSIAGLTYDYFKINFGE